MKTHGFSGKGRTPEYRSWEAMHTRCRKPSHNRYLHYGGRGIAVCDEWKSFEVFLRDMGLKPTRAHSLERIDVNDGYFAANCRWATAKEQANNQTRNVLLTVNGLTRTMAQWSEMPEVLGVHGMSYNALKHRIRRLGWSPERALTEPVVMGRRRVRL